RKGNYAVSIERLLDAVERRGDVGRRVVALVLPISDRPRVTSSCTGELSLREPGEHTSGPNLTSRDNVAHNRTLYNSGNAAIYVDKGAKPSNLPGDQSQGRHGFRSPGAESAIARRRRGDRVNRTESAT